MNRQSTTRESTTAKTSKATGTRKTSRKSAVPAVAGRKEMTRSTASAARKAGPPATDPQTRHEMIAQAAYFHAERRGFADGGELGDWLEAEGEIERALAG